LFKTRVSQNKFKKNTELDDSRTLRSENQKLRKANKRLQKELTKFLNRELESQGDEDPPTLKAKETCPKCKSESIKKVDLGIKNILFCQDCKYRKVL
jgi:predicted Zn-ribbon and HTH transcriptional regulator